MIIKKINEIFDKKKSTIGLDIGLSSIKMMELGGEDLNSLELKKYAIVNIPMTVRDENGDLKEENIDQVAELVRNCWIKMGTQIKNVVLSVNSNNIISKNIKIPNFDNEKDYEMAIRNEFSKYIPEGISVDDLSLDFITIDEDEDNNEHEVLVIACKKEKIDFLQAICSSSGLVVDVVEVESFAIENLIKLMKGIDFYTGSYIFIDCSYSMIRAYSYIDGLLMGVRESNIGGLNYTKDLMTNLDISYDEAEKLKINRSDDDVFLAIENNFLNNYKSEVMSIISYFYSTSSMLKIDDIMLSGGVAKIPNFETIIKNEILNTGYINLINEPYIASPLENATMSKNIDLEKFKNDEASLFLVTSLAIRKYLEKIVGDES